jgi:hypothetical protein
MFAGVIALRTTKTYEQNYNYCLRTKKKKNRKRKQLVTKRKNGVSDE